MGVLCLSFIINIMLYYSVCVLVYLQDLIPFFHPAISIGQRVDLNFAYVNLRTPIFIFLAVA